MKGQYTLLNTSGAQPPYNVSVTTTRKLGGLNFCMDALMRTDGWPYIYLITEFGYLFPVQVTSIKLVCLIGVRNQTLLVRERTRERYGHTSTLPLKPWLPWQLPQYSVNESADPTKLEESPPENFQKNSHIALLWVTQLMDQVSFSGQIPGLIWVSNASNLSSRYYTT